MRIVAAHQHEQTIFLRHVDDVRNGSDAMPTLRDDLQLRGNADFAARTAEAANDVLLPLADGCGPCRRLEQLVQGDLLEHQMRLTSLIDDADVASVDARETGVAGTAAL